MRVLFSNPSNPVGNLMSWAFQALLERRAFTSSSTIYSGFTHGNEEFVSMAKVLDSEDFDMSRIHLVYGLSRDLSLPRQRVGIIYSSNENIFAAGKKLARFSSISTPTQHLQISMLSDTRLIQEFIKTKFEKLQKMSLAFVEGLKQLGIECTNSGGGFYC